MEKVKLIKITNSTYFQERQLQGQLKFFSLHFDVLAVAPSSDTWNDLLIDQGVRGTPIYMARNINPFMDVISLVKLIKLFIKEKPTIVHSHTPKAGLLGMLAAWITQVPIRMHTVTGFPLTTAKGKKKMILRVTERLTYACATRVYPNSKKMRDIIIFMGLCNPNKLTVIGNGSSNGIDTSFFSNESVEEIKPSPYRFTFAFAGRIFYEKGINELIAAFIRLQKDFPSVGLRLIGFMEEDLYPVETWVKEAIQENKQIEFVGFQSDIRSYLLGCDVFVFPSYREGFPNVVMQAGSLGLAQIVSDINGCNEIIIQNENGLIVPPQNEEDLYIAMKYLVKNPDQVKRMAGNAREMIVSRYERQEVWDLMLKEYKRNLSDIEEPAVVLDC